MDFNSIWIRFQIYGVIREDDVTLCFPEFSISISSYLFRHQMIRIRPRKKIENRRDSNLGHPDAVQAPYLQITVPSDNFLMPSFKSLAFHSKKIFGSSSAVANMSIRNMPAVPWILKVVQRQYQEHRSQDNTLLGEPAQVSEKQKLFY